MNSTAKWLTARQAALSRSFGQGWTIMARWASSKAPRSSMSTLPPPPSSAGVPSTSTVTPSSSATSASASAAPTEDAPMMLWPQAWPTSGSASYSAHRATTRGPSPKRAEKAVSSWQIPRSTAIPDADRTSVSWSTAKRSSKASSGRAWMAWLSVTSRSRCRSSAWRARALRSPAVLATEPGLLDDRDHVTPADRGPLGHSELGDGAVLVGRDRVLHLHSLEDANGLACLDRVADRDQDPDDGPLHGNGDRPGAGGAGRRAPVPPGDRSGNLRPWRSRAVGHRTARRHPQLHLVAAAVHLRRHLAQDPAVVGPGRGAGGLRHRRHRAQVEGLFDPAGRVAGLGEVGVAQDGHVGRDRAGDSFDLGLLERPQHPAPGRLSVGGPHRQLRHEVVVVLADRVPSFVPGVEPNPGAGRGAEAQDGPRRGQEPPPCRVLGVEADLDGVAACHDLVLGEVQRLTARHLELPGHQVEAGDELSDRVLDLEPGVHLQEVELPVLVEELDGAGVGVVAGPGDPHRRLAHGPADLVGEVGSRALLDELLVAALAGAVALAQPHDVAVAVRQDLHLDMPRPGQVALEVDLVPPEGRLGLPLGR